jgi:hypothetical protein
MSERKVDLVASLLAYSLRCKEVPKMKYWEFADRWGTWKDITVKKTTVLSRAAVSFRSDREEKEKEDALRNITTGIYEHTFVPLITEDEQTGYILWIRGQTMTLHKCSINDVSHGPDTYYRTLYVEDEKGKAVSLLSLVKMTLTVKEGDSKLVLKLFM